MRHVEVESFEWKAMWGRLAAIEGFNSTRELVEVTLNSQNNEQWQYMGTVEKVHQFRHRANPVAGGQREYRNLAE